MRKIFAVAMAATLAGCGPSTDGKNVTPSTVEEAKPIVDAQQILDGLKSANLPIDKIRTITAESDGNQLLGRPHQYTSKADFVDTRFPDGKVDAANNTIEVFTNSEDAARRRDYVDGIIKNMPMLTQYLYLRKNVLVRIDVAVSPDAAKQYETAVAKIVG